MLKYFFYPSRKSGNFGLTGLIGFIGIYIYILGFFKHSAKKDENIFFYPIL